MVDFSKWEDFVDMQARAFCAHAESNLRLKELASCPYNELSEAEQDELFRLFNYAELSFSEGEGDDWWK